MAETVNTPAPSADVVDPAAEAFYCPLCGYDLRGTVADRCNECGLVIDRTAIGRSEVPWAHRRQIGRLRAFWRTVGLVILDRRKLRQELLHPQVDHDANRFRLWNAACIWLAMMFVLTTILFIEGLGVLAAADDKVRSRCGVRLRPWTACFRMRLYLGRPASLFFPPLIGLPSMIWNSFKLVPVLVVAIALTGEGQVQATPVELSRDDLSKMANILSVSASPHPKDADTIVVSLSGPIRPNIIVTARVLIGSDGNKPDIDIPLRITIPTNTPKNPPAPVTPWYSHFLVKATRAESITVEVTFQAMTGAPSIYRVAVKSLLTAPPK